MKMVNYAVSSYLYKRLGIEHRLLYDRKLQKTIAFFIFIECLEIMGQNLVLSGYFYENDCVIENICLKSEERTWEWENDTVLCLLERCLPFG